VVAPSVLDRLVARRGNAVLVDPSRAAEADLGAEVHGGQIRTLAKGLPPERISAEGLGMSRWNGPSVPALAEALHNLLEGGRPDLWYPCAISEVARVLPVAALHASNPEWVEIGSLADLEAANAQIAADPHPTSPSKWWWTDPD